MRLLESLRHGGERRKEERRKEEVKKRRKKKKITGRTLPAKMADPRDAAR